MLFSSINFLFYFLPVVFILYYLVPFRFKNYVLLAASLFFYAWGEPVYVFLMLATITSGYIHGLLIGKYRGTKLSKFFMITSVTISLLLLGFFKYTDFFITNTNALFGTHIDLLKLALPIGISFYSFQTLSYTVDVYRGEAEVQRNYIKLATYVALFPQLIAGPIVRYTTVEQELTKRTHSFENFAKGISRFLWGLGKKVLIANQLGELCDLFRASDEKTVLFYWVYAIAFSLHIYFDFSGYSDMAIGLGKCFGFNFLENFNYPYISRTITEFWRRWHMSLGSWFRDYVYIPLGGNRVSKPKYFRNIAVVWFLTGFWHGADWTFIVWGLMFAVLLIIEKLFLYKALEKMPKGLRFINHIYVLFFVIISFVIFNANGMGQAVSDIGGMFGFAGVPLSNEITLYYLKSFAPVIVLAVIGATPLMRKCVVALKNRSVSNKVLNILEPIAACVILLVCTAYLVDGSFNPFLYFRF